MNVNNLNNKYNNNVSNMFVYKMAGLVYILTMFITISFIFSLLKIFGYSIDKINIKKNSFNNNADNYNNLNHIRL